MLRSMRRGTKSPIMKVFLLFLAAGHLFFVTTPAAAGAKEDHSEEKTKTKLKKTKKPVDNGTGFFDHKSS